MPVRAWLTQSESCWGHPIPRAASQLDRHLAQGLVQVIMNQVYVFWAEAVDLSFGNSNTTQEMSGRQTCQALILQSGAVGTHARQEDSRAVTGPGGTASFGDDQAAHQHW